MSPKMIPTKVFGNSHLLGNINSWKLPNQETKVERHRDQIIILRIHRQEKEGGTKQHLLTWPVIGKPMILLYVKLRPSDAG